jgi:hypothetical protein
VAEAAFALSLERNADAVRATAFAPVLANVHGTQWPHVLLKFDAGRLVRTPSQGRWSNTGRPPRGTSAPHLPAWAICRPRPRHPGAWPAGAAWKLAAAPSSPAPAAPNSAGGPPCNP